jgi:hypothetical protein
VLSLTHTQTPAVGKRVAWRKKGRKGAEEFCKYYIESLVSSMSPNEN